MHRSRPSSDEGSASLEFVTVGLILLVPLVYLVLAMSALQAGALAAEGAARQAARVFVRSDTTAAAHASASRAVEFALSDHGLGDADTTIGITCRPDPDDCLARRGFVTITVSVYVPLPLAPPVLGGGFPLGVSLQSSATQQVSRYGGVG